MTVSKPTSERAVSKRLPERILYSHAMDVFMDWFALAFFVMCFLIISAILIAGAVTLILWVGH